MSEDREKYGSGLTNTLDALVVHSVRGVNVLWKRSPIQPVPPWADTCSLCGKSINSVSAKVSYVNAKLLGPWKVRYRKTVKMQHICRDCREAVRPLQKERRERWKRVQADIDMHNARLDRQEAERRADEEVEQNAAPHTGAVARTVQPLVRLDVDPTDWRRCGFLRHTGDKEDCEMRSGEECCHDATKCKYWHER